MRRDMMTARFRRDNVAALAVVLFFLILAAEMFVAVWIPMRLYRDSVFADSVVRISTMSKFDGLRKDLGKSIKKQTDPAVITEMKMLLAQLNTLAIYLKTDDRSKELSMENVELVRAELENASRQFYRLNNGKSVSSPLKPDITPCIKAIAEGKI
ncbi:MAG: hypothetical protein AB7F40_03855 [Victivallaceae bacterium]|nr:hypothetical protein [Victivallaceae bacterium]